MRNGAEFIRRDAFPLSFVLSYRSCQLREITWKFTVPRERREGETRALDLDLGNKLMNDDFKSGKQL